MDFKGRIAKEWLIVCTILLMSITISLVYNYYEYRSNFEYYYRIDYEHLLPAQVLERLSKTDQNKYLDMVVAYKLTFLKKGEPVFTTEEIDRVAAKGPDNRSFKFVPTATHGDDLSKEAINTFLALGFFIKPQSFFLGRLHLMLAGAISSAAIILGLVSLLRITLWAIKVVKK